MSLPHALFAVAPTAVVLAHQARARVAHFQRGLSRRRRACGVRARRASDGARVRVPPSGCAGGQAVTIRPAYVVSADLEFAGRHIGKTGCREGILNSPVVRSTNNQMPGARSAVRARRRSCGADNRSEPGRAPPAPLRLAASSPTWGGTRPRRARLTGGWSPERSSVDGSSVCSKRSPATALPSYAISSGERAGLYQHER
jgi:hypothetical protein